MFAGYNVLTRQAEPVLTRALAAKECPSVARKSPTGRGPFGPPNSVPSFCLDPKPDGGGTRTKSGGSEDGADNRRCTLPLDPFRVPKGPTSDGL